MKLSLTFNVRPLEKAKSTVLVTEYLRWKWRRILLRRKSNL